MAFLASDDARYIAGETVEITGAKPVGCWEEAQCNCKEKWLS
jgi:hypothetical protein